MTKLKPEKPAEGILKTNEFFGHTSHSLWYKISCNCLSNDHTVDMEIEIDDDRFLVHLHTVATDDYWTEYWHESNWKSPWLYQVYRIFGGFVNSTIRKLKTTRDIWFKGYTEFHSTHILTDQQALNVAQVLQEGLSEYRKQTEGKV